MLNQNYEALTICSARRAIVLLFQGKAEMVEAADSLKIHSVSAAWDCPSIVRLWEYRKVPHKRIILTRKNIIIRDRHRCQYCGAQRGGMTVDHVMPKKMGGADTWENLVCACARCNNRKGDRTLEQSAMKLLKQPMRPSYITFIQRNRHISDRWRPYLFMEPRG